MSARIVSTELLENKDARWINLVKITYEDQNGKARTWEATRRPTRPKNSAVDAVQMVVVLQKPSGPELLLEKQFRPPAGKLVVEFPAGLVDEGETIEQAALRELHEETGYIGEVVLNQAEKHPIFFSSPGSSSSCTSLVHLKVDPEKGENRSPKPQLEDGEFIEPFWVPVSELHKEVQKLAAEGFAIDGKLGAFAEGLMMAKMWQA
ncbi:NUDIX domain-containing protein [Xylariomycetidae sp. FL0641]|nr:NUDIX domain-containing protein [Xylariomycetidae sp. FL0641]